MESQNRRNTRKEILEVSSLLSSVRGVVFDLDGTLVDAFGDIVAAVNYGLRTLDRPELPFETIKRFVGNGVPTLARRALGPDHEDLGAELARLLVEYYRAHPADHARIYPGAVETVRVLQRGGIRTAVLSNKRHELTVLVLDRLGFTPHLDFVGGEGEEIAAKPDPAGFFQVADRLGLRPDQLLMIGDGEPDGLVARNASAPFVGVAWGLLPREQLIELGALTILDRLADLLPLFGLALPGSST